MANTPLKQILNYIICKIVVSARLIFSLSKLIWTKQMTYQANMWSLKFKVIWSCIETAVKELLSESESYFNNPFREIWFVAVQKYLTRLICSFYQYQLSNTSNSISIKCSMFYIQLPKCLYNFIKSCCVYLFINIP